MLPGALRLIVGGDEAVFRRCEPLLHSVFELVLSAGSSVSGTMVKLANNFLSILDLAMMAKISLVMETTAIASEIFARDFFCEKLRQQRRIPAHDVSHNHRGFCKDIGMMYHYLKESR